MGAPFLEPPGRAAATYRSDEMAFRTAKVPDRALAAKRFVETHYRGADFLGTKRGRAWNGSTALRPEPLRGMRRDEARAKCLSTTRDGLTLPRHTSRPFGFGGDPLGATATKARELGAEAATRRRAFSFSPAAAGKNSDAARDASRRETALVKRERDSGVVKGALGVGHRSIAFEKPFAASSRAPGGWSASVAVGRDEKEVATEVSRRVSARAASLTILERSAKRYVSPFQAEIAKQKTIRALKAKGEWPNPKPPVTVIPGTTRSRAKKADLRAVADLDAFDPNGR